MRTLRNFKFKGKIVLVRVDLNSDVVNKRIILSERFKAHAETIKYLKNKKARVVVIAHQGRPGQKDFTSLEQHCGLLNKFVKIRFVDDIIGVKAVKSIIDLKDGEAILLDNVRKLEDEFKGNSDNKFVKVLSKVCDYYVNDAFSVSHRKQSSIVGFPKKLKSFMGLNLEKEIKYLKKLKIKKALYILGGAKAEDNILLLNKNKVLSCGLFGQICLISKGFNFGAQNKFLKKKLKIKNKLKNKLKNVETPVDFAVKVGDKRVELKLNEFPSRYQIHDIGNETIKKYVDEIKKARVIFMKGPAGNFDLKNFSKGTKEILRAVEKNKGFKVIGGGDLSTAAARYKIKKIDYISLSGGALIAFVAGKKLPGLEALK